MIYAKLARSTRLALISFAMVLTFVFPGIAAETIKTYSVNILVLANGSVDVTETIKVSVEGQKIRRGIFRDIPTILTNADGSTIRSNLNVVSVLRDGIEEPFQTSSITNGTRIRIGDANVFLPHKTFTYTIHYTMTRMARSFEDHDELYWNATGNFWDFAIDEALVQVTLPQGAKITELAAYTGAQGESGRDAKFRQTADNKAFFRSTRVFLPKEGMSVAVLFEKGVLAEPTLMQNVIYFLSDHRNQLFPLGAVLIVLLYFYFAWDAVGRDPEKGTIIPLFRPPEGFSPALVHFIHHMGWKKTGWTAYSAALISLATKGHLDIEKGEKEKIAFTHLEKPDDALPRGEAVIEDYLARKGKLKVDKSSGPSINSNRKKFIKAIVSENRHAYFRHNFLYSAFGIALSFLIILGLVAGGILPPSQGIVLLAMGIGVGFLTSAAGTALNSGGFGQFFVFGWFGIVAINMLGNFATLMTSVKIDTPLIASVSIVLINVTFIFLMRAPTIHGRKIMDQIDGFKMYLETAEENRLNFTNEPNFDISRFEAILPFAIALGVEKPWAKRLEGEFARNALAQSQRGYQPVWYHGSGFNSYTLSRSVSGIASSMSSAMVSAQPSSSSSSGGGGGGFSGGGGGGGGGGGW